MIVLLSNNMFCFHKKKKKERKINEKDCSAIYKEAVLL